MPATRDIGTSPQPHGPTPLLQRRGNLHVLVIGINAYEHWNPLQCAVQDAEAVAEVLMQRYGVRQEHVVRLLDGDATADNLDRTLRAYRKGGARALSADDDLLIFYAGHGFLDEDANLGYWIPVDANTDAAGQWIPNVQIKAHLRALDARHVFIISDSCFSGDFLRREVPGNSVRNITEKWVATAYSRMSRQVLTSGGLEPVNDTGMQGHSVFTHFLLKALRENTSPWLLPADLYQRVRDGVAANASQIPLLGHLHDAGGEVDGEFVLFPRSTQNESVRQQELEEARKRQKHDNTTRLTPEDILKAEELANWHYIAAKQNETLLREHLTRFPDGVTRRYALEALEDLLWRKLEKTADIKALQYFLQQFPDGSHADDARNKLKRMQHALEKKGEQKRKGISCKFFSDLLAIFMVPYFVVITGMLFDIMGWGHVGHPYSPYFTGAAVGLVISWMALWLFVRARKQPLGDTAVSVIWLGSALTGSVLMGWWFLEMRWGKFGSPDSPGVTGGTLGLVISWVALWLFVRARKQPLGGTAVSVIWLGSALMGSFLMASLVDFMEPRIWGYHNLRLFAGGMLGLVISWVALWLFVRARKQPLGGTAISVIWLGSALMGSFLMASLADFMVPRSWGYRTLPPFAGGMLGLVISWLVLWLFVRIRKHSLDESGWYVVAVGSLSIWLFYIWVITWGY